MKVRKLLELQSNIEERKVPCDLCDDELKPHYSESKGEFKNILDFKFLVALLLVFSSILILNKKKFSAFKETFFKLKKLVLIVIIYLTPEFVDILKSIFI